MTERELADAIEILPDRLYWVALHTLPRNTSKSHYFCIDNELVYEPFFADFGPLKLSMVHVYSRMLEAKLADPALADKRIVHYCANEPKRRANSACLMGCFQVIALGRNADQAYEPFMNLYPPFLPFRDAINGPCRFELTILDCLKGLEKSIELGWYDWNRFDFESYDFFEKVDNGDMNWIVPDKFLAFAGPCPTPTDADGYPAFTPEDYVPIFREAGISLVVRLNKKQYDRRRFIDHGIKHVDLYFLDGSCPPRDIVDKFLHIAEHEPGAVGVHCKAGLGRTCTLIGLYAMKHHNFPARAFIGWNRICRPGSVLGPQQQFLIDMQPEMFQAGAALRRPGRPLGVESERALADDFERMHVRGERHQGEQFEDVGQGERLRGAKRGGGGGGGVRGFDLASAAGTGDMSPASRVLGPGPGARFGIDAAGASNSVGGASNSVGSSASRAGPPPGGLSAAAGLGAAPRLPQEIQQPQQSSSGSISKSLRGIFKP